jgi:surface antigen
MATATTTTTTTIKPTLALDSLAVAKSQLGLEEIPRGSNWGVNVKKYLASVGIDFPASWCMSFVYWCVNEACKKRGIKNPLVPTGGVLNQWANVDAKMKATKGPQPGDIFIMDFGSGHGHTGFVESVNGDRINTVEGNSNADGSREGYEVCRKPNGRPVSSIKGFIRLP